MDTNLNFLITATLQPVGAFDILNLDHLIQQNS